MAFIRQKAYDNAIQKVRIEFGDLLGLKDPAEAYIVLKELPTMETMALGDAQKQGAKEVMQYFKDILPRIIVEHNLYETDDKKMSNDAIADFIYEKVELTQKVCSGYLEATFFIQKSKGAEK